MTDPKWMPARPTRPSAKQAKSLTERTADEKVEILSDFMIRQFKSFEERLGRVEKQLGTMKD